MKTHTLYLILALVFSSCITQNHFISFNNDNLQYEGRILYESNAAQLIWPGTSVGIMFQGDSLYAVMQDLDTANYYNIIIDNKVTGSFHTDTTKQTYLLAKNLNDKAHWVQIFKRTEWDKGKTLFYGFEITKGSKLLAPPAPKKRKIEFFGNSITCGYAIEDSSGNDSGHGYHQNNYLTYAALAARYFNAQYHCTAKSGIGITLSWFPMIMSEMYDKLDPYDSTSIWDFNQYTPDVVVVNLFQNDSWLVERPDFPEFIHRFGTEKPREEYIIDAYKDFVATIRNTYPYAYIICALGSMDATREDSAWPGYITEAVEQLNDQKIYTHFFPYKGTYGHPIVSEQQRMAKSLISFIEENIEW